MKILHVVVFCCFSVVCVKTSAVLEVSGRVGGEVSIHCSVGWTKDNGSEHNNMYFCRGVCSRENILVETERKGSAVTGQGRYSIEVSGGYGVFNVTIKKLQAADAGRYCCGGERTMNVLYQEVELIVLDAPTVRPGSLPRGSFQSTTESSPAVLTLSTTPKTNKKATINLTDTTVVIIISVSLALLVCALIPLVFYGHWRSNAEGQSRPQANLGQGDYCEENADGASTQGMVKLQPLEPDPESSAQDDSQYAVIYQALDPQTVE
ncbi:uncharacterized protein LOC118311927 isoform X1 [Scophthalmus maximus]|uniref:uncharacterized protein LOC118311927 isoform X1 n=1 Tax=Scophthalmus maximus TaxID=52904 RepID=UPI001FA81BCB|nr:uncharacterized protein LOC118311927 isoform X1 [Scophthalmus maximus]